MVAARRVMGNSPQCPPHRSPYSSSGAGGHPSPVEGIVLVDREDMSFLGDLMSCIRNHAQRTRFNKNQAKILADRCGAIHRTLSMMHQTAPSPNVLSAFRSAEYLLRQHVHPSSWTSFLLHRFTASELFESCREKIRKVWSLQSTARWESEDHEAETKDAKENVLLIADLGLIAPVTVAATSCASTTGGPALRPAKKKQGSTRQPHHGPPDSGWVDQETELIGYYHRRKISGWKTPWSEIERLPAPADESNREGGGLGSAMLEEEPTSSMCLRHFHRSLEERSCALYYDGVPVSVYELTDPSVISPRTLESFVIDMKCRSSWCHPNLVRTVGGFAEKFDADDNPFLSLGVVVENLRARGFMPLSEMLYHKGRRLPVATCMHIVLTVADALQYAIFSSEDVTPEVAASWSIVSPDNVFVSFISESGLGLGEEMGGGARTEEEEGGGRQQLSLDEIHALLGTTRDVDCDVRFLPHFFVEDGDVSRWVPPYGCVNPQCYSLTQLFVALLSNAQPFPDLEYQQELKELRKPHAPLPLDPDHPTQNLAQSMSMRIQKKDDEVDGFTIPRSLPVSVQHFIAMGFKHHRYHTEEHHHHHHHTHRQPSDSLQQHSHHLSFWGYLASKLMVGVSTDVAEDDTSCSDTGGSEQQQRPRAFVSIQHFRKELAQLLRSESVTSLPCFEPPNVLLQEQQQRQQHGREPYATGSTPPAGSVDGGDETRGGGETLTTGVPTSGAVVGGTAYVDLGPLNVETTAYGRTGAPPRASSSGGNSVDFAANAVFEEVEMEDRRGGEGGGPTGTSTRTVPVGVGATALDSGPCPVSSVGRRGNIREWSVSF